MSDASMFHDPRLFDALDAARATPPVDTRMGPGRPAIAPLTMLGLCVVSAGLWAGIAWVATSL